MTTETANTTFGRTTARGQRQRPRLDLGRPRWLLREQQPDGSTRETWIWCDRCLARKAGDGERGDLVAGWRGGRLYTFRDLPGATAGTIYRRRAELVPCTCRLGEIVRQRAQRHLRRRLPDASFFPPEQLLGPPVAELARNPKDRTVEIVGPLGDDDPRLDAAPDGLDDANQEDLPF